MYLLFFIIGAVTGALIDSSMLYIFGFGFLGIAVALLFKAIASTNKGSSSSSSAFDGCLIFILLESIIMGLSG